MSDLPTLTSQIQPPVDTRWLWALRIATVICLMPVLALTAQLFLPSRDFSGWYVLALLTPASLLYVLWGLRGNPPTKFALALAGAWGALPGVLLAIGAVLISTDYLSTLWARGYATWSWQTWLVPLQALLLITVAATFIQRARERNWSPWLWTVRVLAAASIICAALGLHAAVRDFIRFGVLDVIRAVILAGIGLAYVSVIWGLRGSRRHQANQALFTAGGVAIVAVALFLTGPLGGPKQSTNAEGLLAENAILNLIVFGGLAIVLSTYAGVALYVYYLLKREPGDWRRLLGGFAVVILVGLTLSAATSEKIRRQQRHMHSSASAVGSLRTINTAEITFASTYNHGYSSTLAAPGPGAAGAPPTESAADLIDEVLASSRKNGYTFIYTPGERNQKGEIWTYTLCARPLSSNNGVRRSFFTDESGVIHFTTEDRCATAKDPELTG